MTGLGDIEPPGKDSAENAASGGTRARQITLLFVASLTIMSGATISPDLPDIETYFTEQDNAAPDAPRTAPSRPPDLVFSRLLGGITRERSAMMTRPPVRSPAMLDHTSITVSDIAGAAPFWDAIMAALGHPCVVHSDTQLGFGTRNRPEDDAHSYLSIFQNRGPALVPDNRHWCFRAPSRAAVDAFHAAGLANGGSCDGPPGLRADYHPGYYAAFLRDPDGNRVEAVHHRIPQDD